MYPVTAGSPASLGADHDTVTSPSPRTPDTPTGSPGALNGVTVADGADGSDDPTAFVAVTVNE